MRENDGDDVICKLLNITGLLDSRVRGNDGKK